MNELKLLIENGQSVVSSRQVADDFSRIHKDVVNSIEKLIEGIGKSSSTYFTEEKYQNEQNKQMYKEYFMNRDGFSLLVMGFNGASVLKWKLRYIQAFNEMEQTIKNGQPQLSKELQAIFSIDKRTVEMDNRLTTLEGSMTIDYSQQEELKSMANKKVVEILGGKDAPAYKECSKKAFSEFWKSFRRIMQVNSYKNTATKEYLNARGIIANWKPNRDLELMILGANSQLKINL